MNFCPVCGKDTESTFCDEHRQVNITYKDVLVRICACKKYFYRNLWNSFESLKKTAEKIAKDNIKEKATVNALIDEKLEKKKFEIEATYQGEIFVIPAKVQVERCPICSKNDGAYFVSTLQIRPRDDELLEFVKNLAEKDDQVFISRIMPLKEGYNILLSSNKGALKIGKKLDKSFKGELKTTRKLFSRDSQRSKDLFRSTVLFRRE